MSTTDITVLSTENVSSSIALNKGGVTRRKKIIDFRQVSKNNTSSHKSYNNKLTPFFSPVSNTAIFPDLPSVRNLKTENKENNMIDSCHSPNVEFGNNMAGVVEQMRKRVIVCASKNYSNILKKRNNRTEEEEKERRNTYVGEPKE